MAERKPNVVLINCDDLGYGDLGCYGSRVNDTPFLDSLAARGRLFTCCYAAAPICSPSRAGLLTGCYPPRVGIDRVLFPGDPVGLAPGEYTLGSLFRDSGYRTMLVGKWHCGDQAQFLPCNFGFDRYYGLPYSNDMGMQRRSDGAHCPPLPLLADGEVIQQQPDQRALTERYAEKCCEFIRSAGGAPFFLYFAQMHVHLPLYAAERFVRASRNGDFGACTAELDWASAAVWHELRRQGLLENTLVLFTSDNGSRADHGASNAPLRGAKFTTWEGGLRVPLLAYWQGHIRPGRCDAPVSQIDFLPSFAALLGTPLPKRRIDGLELSDTLFGSGSGGRADFAYYSHSGRLEAVRDARWKLHLSVQGEPVCLLYDLQNDPMESQDLSQQLPEVTGRMRQLFRRLAAETGNTLDGTPGREMRRAGREEHPVFLCSYDPDCPYMVAEYDKDDVG